MEKTLDYYMSLPYTIEMRQDSEGGWFVRVKELRGCMSEGDTPEEAATMIREAMELWLEVALEEGIPIPEPRPEEDYSGKFVVRVPRSLHRELAQTAEQEGVSLNQYINVALAHSVGRPLPAPAEQSPAWPGVSRAVRSKGH
jgi:antitoxin HicB